MKREKKKESNSHRDEELPPVLVLVPPAAPASRSPPRSPSGRVVKHSREREPPRRHPRRRGTAAAGLHPQGAPLDERAVRSPAGVGRGLWRGHDREREAAVPRRGRARREVAQAPAIVWDHAHLDDDGIGAGVGAPERRLEGAPQRLVVDRGREVPQKELALVRGVVGRRGGPASAAAGAGDAAVGVAQHVSPGGVEARGGRDAKVGARGEPGLSAAAAAAPAAATELLQKVFVLVVVPSSSCSSASASPLHPRHVAGVLRLDAGLDRGRKLESIARGPAAGDAARGALELAVARAAAEEAGVALALLERTVDDGQLAELLVLGVVKPVVLRVEHGRDLLRGELHGLAGVACFFCGDFYFYFLIRGWEKRVSCFRFFGFFSLSRYLVHLCFPLFFFSSLSSRPSGFPLSYLQ